MDPATANHGLEQLDQNNTKKKKIRFWLCFNLLPLTRSKSQTVITVDMTFNKQHVKLNKG